MNQDEFAKRYSAIEAAHRAKSIDVLMEEIKAMAVRHPVDDQQMKCGTIGEFLVIASFVAGELHLEKYDHESAVDFRMSMDYMPGEALDELLGQLEGEID